MLVRTRLGGAEGAWAARGCTSRSIWPSCRLTSSSSDLIVARSDFIASISVEADPWAVADAADTATTPIRTSAAIHMRAPIHSMHLVALFTAYPCLGDAPSRPP